MKVDIALANILFSHKSQEGKSLQLK